MIRKFYTNPLKGEFLRIEADYAIKNVLVPLTFNKHLLLNSTAGLSGDCLLSVGITNFAKANPKAFPHPVLIVDVQQTRIRIVDEVDNNGNPTHIVIYGHNQGTWPDLFDKIPKHVFTKRFEGQQIILELTALESRPSGSSSGQHTNAKTPKFGGFRMSEGSLRRAQNAGYFNPTRKVA